MRSSHLTRNVYRRLLAGHGLLRTCRPCHPAVHSGRSLSTCPRTHLRLLPLQFIVRRPQRRTFFGMFQKPPRELKEPELEPGYDTLLKFRSMETENARPPPRDELLQGFRQFFKYKKRYHKTLNTTQAFLATRLLRHLVETTPNFETEFQRSGDLTVEDLRIVMEVALKAPVRGKHDDHLALSKLLYREIERISTSIPEEPVGNMDAGTSTEGTTTTGKVGSGNDFQSYITALTQYGGSLEAAERLAEQWPKLLREEKSKKGAKALWTLVLRGLAREGREEELIQNFEKATTSFGVEYMPPVHQIMTTFFAARDRVDETKQWFEKPIYASWAPTAETYLELVRFALRNNQQPWIQPIFEQLINSNPQKSRWDVIFQWAVLAMDKGVEDIKQMIATMIRHNPDESKGVRPDATTIDCLIKAAIEKKNPYLAERFLSLGAELDIPPKSSTYILQMDYRLDAKDFSGAHAIYKKLQNREVEVWNDEDLPVLNKYLRALCAVENADVERILNVTSEMEERRATLEPETVVSLCMVFLRVDQQYEVIDTLSLHTVGYSLEERAEVREAFVQYILDRKTSTARVWDAYSLLRQFFPETEPADRVKLMEAFFNRKRPDMACYIFGHMRGHGNPNQRPTADMYTRCLERLGRYPDGDSLKMVHNMLKMDTTVQMNTRLYNALMIAYVACDDPATAMEFWGQITHSVEGPSYNSLAIVFRVCESLVPGGDRHARAIWQKMQRMELEVPPNVFWSYCGAIAGQGHVEEVQRLIQGMDAAVGYPPTAMTLGVTYNALPGTSRKEYFEEWAKEEYPEIWARLESKGKKETMQGDMFNISRVLEA
ncbi:complex I intermediate-associated protein 84, mitochondrial [Diplogelasinospora grovesii]|uniref:Complex I intermediate-associated protein 84, mitochondrial n=1 Tax=Diplogelasinospora grovesii TaxID=303347 RepID=A0AAN6NHK9_9PEZI|nr:complex I intermediate-associated protein 84, mitochondrial [Diplogelasinospora grovesii]